MPSVKSLEGETGVQLDAEDEAWMQSFVGMTAQTNEGLMGRYRLLGNLISHLSAKRDGIEEIQQAAFH